MQTRPISKELQKKAERELNEYSSEIPDHIKHIRKWLSEQPHLNARTDDQSLLNFLRACQFDNERTKEKMELFLTMKTFIPEIYTKRDPFLPEIQESLNQGVVLPLLKTVDDAGPRIVLVRYGALNPKISFEAMTKTALMILDIMMSEDDNSIIGGQQGFIDVKNISMDFLTSLNLDFCKRVIKCLEKAYPTRPKKVDFVNAPPILEMVFPVCETFISERLSSMINICTIYSEDVYQTIPRHILPPEYGGEGDSVKVLTAHWKQKVESYKDWLLEDEQYHSDESKRPGKPKTSADVFQTHKDPVPLRQLEID